MEPRLVPPIKAARRLHLTLAEFNQVIARLLQRGFPHPDPDIGHYDLKAIDEWLDRQMGMQQGTVACDPREVWAERLARGDVFARPSVDPVPIPPELHSEVIAARLKLMRETMGKRKKRQRAGPD